MSEHRESFEKGNADADPVEFGGRLASLREEEPESGETGRKEREEHRGSPPE